MGKEKIRACDMVQQGHLAKGGTVEQPEAFYLLELSCQVGGGCAPPTVVCTILLIGHCYHLGRRAPGEHGVHVPLQSPAVFFHICH